MRSFNGAHEFQNQLRFWLDVLSLDEPNADLCIGAKLWKDQLFVDALVFIGLTSLLFMCDAFEYKWCNTLD